MTVAAETRRQANFSPAERQARAACRRICCVTDQQLLADGLRARIEADPALEWSGFVPTYESIVGFAAQGGADLAVIDLNTESVNVFEFIRSASTTAPTLRLVALADPVRDRNVREAFDAGVKAFFSKRDDPQQILSGLRAVAAGRAVQNGHALNGAAAKNGGSDDRHTTRLDLLTRRELDILRLFGQGLTRVEIANVLHRSPKTIDCHRASLMKKLEVSDRVELARYAIREGLAEA